MIQLEATIDDDDILTGYHANGHAGAGERGADIVCAAISVLSRSLARALRGKEGINISMDTLERGTFSAAISYSDNAKQFLRGAGSFLLEGLRSVAEEYPEHCNLTIVKIKRPKT
ncbi:MAG: ribosomal-processing cysteine protease Prp [Spirochaetaceae bacterium]|jgi:uncharacterized protein YsxB (DUF464 family)|nr:ribosomal-processing cysteine protease Prp [Spirochaetaceae bacterium]